MVDELLVVHEAEVVATLARRPAADVDARPAGGPGGTRLHGRALLWNWIIAGSDAHAKNYSLLLAGSDVRLAPFYDIASALPYDGMPIQKLRLAMKFGGNYELKPTPSIWRRLAADLGVPRATSCIGPRRSSVRSQVRSRPPRVRTM